MDSSSLNTPASTPLPTLFTLPFEIRSVIYSQLLDHPLRLRAPCPLSRSAAAKQKNLLSILQTCRQLRHEAAPFLYRNVHFGWLANMTKVLSSPARKAAYSQYIVNATSLYDVGLIEDCLNAAECLTRLQRLTLLAEVSAIRGEERHISAVWKCVRLYKDDLSSVAAPVSFDIEFRLSVVDFEAKMQRSLVLRVPTGTAEHGQLPDIVSVTMEFKVMILICSERRLHLQHRERDPWEDQYRVASRDCAGCSSQVWHADSGRLLMDSAAMTNGSNDPEKPAESSCSFTWYAP